MSFISELKRRNVIRMAGLYIVGAWLILQVSETILPIFDTPNWVLKLLVYALFVGFIPAMIVAWIFELTPDGLKRDAEVTPENSIAPQTAQKMNRLIVALLVLAVVYFGFDKFVLAPKREVALVVATAQTVKAETLAISQDTVNEASIAVLPFVNMSSDKEQEYFSDGLSEELLNLLAQIPQLKVIARTSSFSFKGKETDVATIAKILNVAHILEGSVRKSGDTLRITAQLIRTSDSTHLWSQTYDRPMADIFAVQDEIAKDVVEALKVKLLPNQNMARLSGNTTNPEAYRLLLLGRNYFEQFTLEGYQQAKAAQQQAIALDPNYAMAYAALATTQVNLSYNESNTDAQVVGYAQAQAWAEKAIALEPQLSHGYRARSKVCEALRDMSCELSAAQQAIALEPSFSDNQLRYGKVRFYSFDINDALVAINKSIELDPLNSEAYLYLGWLQFARGDYTAAHKTFTVLNQLKPNFDLGLQLMGMSSLIQGNTQQARNYFEKLPDQEQRQAYLALLLCHEGKTTEADFLLAKWLKDSNNRYAEIAMLYACRGDADQAFVWVDKLIKKNENISKSFVFYGLEFQPLHSDPRWLPLLRKAGATSEQLAVYKSNAVLPNKRVGKP